LKIREDIGSISCPGGDILENIYIKKIELIWMIGERNGRYWDELRAKWEILGKEISL